MRYLFRSTALSMSLLVPLAEGPEGRSCGCGCGSEEGVERVRVSERVRERERERERVRRSSFNIDVSRY